MLTVRPNKWRPNTELVKLVLIYANKPKGGGGGDGAVQKMTENGKRLSSLCVSSETCRAMRTNSNTGLAGSPTRRQMAPIKMRQIIFVPMVASEM